MLNKTLSILSLLLLEVASTMLLVRPAAAAVVWGTVVDTESAPVVDATVEFAPMADTTQVFSAPTGADGSYSILLEPLSTAVEEGGALSRPEAFQLLQNYPNPFNPSTLIHYNLAEPGPVELAIYNVLGHKVRTLADNYQAAGRYRVEWDGRDGRGTGLSAGVYIYRLRAGGFAASRQRKREGNGGDRGGGTRSMDRAVRGHEGVSRLDKSGKRVKSGKSGTVPSSPAFAISV